MPVQEHTQHDAALPQHTDPTQIDFSTVQPVLWHTNLGPDSPRLDATLLKGSVGGQPARYNLMPETPEQHAHDAACVCQHR